MDVTILSLFPEYFDSPLSVSMLARAIKKGLLQVDRVNIRDFATDRHRTVDDRPYGGGPGMVMKPEPICDAVAAVKQLHSKVIYLSPSGRKLDAKKCETLAEEKHLVLLCGHYEGVDQRVIDIVVDEEISIGDYIITNGALAALVLLDAVARFIPGVLGNETSVYQDSFHLEEGLEAPQYTRPPVYKGRAVPEVLRGGNHQEIKKWQTEHASTYKTL